MSVFRTSFFALGTTIGLFCAACSGQVGGSLEKPAAAQATEGRASVALPTSTAAAPAPAAPGVTAPVASRAASAPMKVKRLVIASAVQDREPVTTTEPLRADGTRIYAFAELANPDGESENVRVTFERRGGKERAGDVLLPVPGKVSRHRTWAFTRHIFAPGQWDAVLRTESGTELSRTSFEVKQS